ncbi:DUF4275 family protein [uncultured Litoreibacter sp.]|uniref:DUF4275 family protein n=1 Tax=uncultured Litoreibacter sp. TaxID=1392394 RepID=UPI00260F9766|nr:DUF4275 family protein [uncultured Litoreibacter sp.]
MSLGTIQIENSLSDHDVDFQCVPASESERLRKQWLNCYAARVKKETGAWIHNRFRWHGFSYGLQAAVAGLDATIAYQALWPAPYFVFEEENTWAYACTSDRYPDLTSLQADIYVAHHNMNWTMVFTHEQPEIGPYLAMKSKNVS